MAEKWPRDVWRRAAWILAAIGIAVLLAWAFRAAPLLVEAAEVRRGPLRIAVQEEARTRVIDRYVISAPVAGYLQRIPLKAGAVVRAGEPLFVIEPMDSELLDPRSRAAAEGRVSAAQAALDAVTARAAAARAAAVFATEEHERAERLRGAGQISAEAADRARAEARSSVAVQRAEEHAIEVARNELEIARAQLAHFDARDGEPAARITVGAPVTGSILRVLRDSAGVVARGEALLEIGDAEALEVVAEVLSDEAVRISPGNRVVLERWGGPALEAVVRVVEPSGFTKISALGVEEQRVMVVADLVSAAAEWASLGDGYRLEASFVLSEEDDVLQIPQSALFRRGDVWHVFVLDGDRVRLREVTPGRRSGLQAEILQGVREGERLVAYPDDALEDGVRITTP
ncbi:MAG: HlyD family efflux transporter periplasmic adaptor subunit [Gammaproteobacteria bacterium]|jgi:HlyD family secretion protein|nr:HlyD family efflux transporter periplasmic adaptor subunit [Gammaproteobacteria bacterium]